MFDLTKILPQVQSALSRYLSREENRTLEALEILEVSPRSFSSVVHLLARTSNGAHRFVMKTTVHHPANKPITDRENQAVVEYEILKNLYPKFEEIQNCAVPRPILVIPEIETYVMDFVEGRLLADEFRYARYFSSQKGFQALKDHYYQSGRWLKLFQEFTGIYSAGVESFDITLERCEQKLKVIEDSGDRRCPKNLRPKVMRFLEEQLSQLAGHEILVTGRHGDFGSWNILAGSQGITVLDFLGYRIDPLPIDLLKMLINFEDEKKYLAYSASRIEALKNSFLDGFGPLPLIPEPVLFICETLHRVCSLCSSVTVSGDKPHRRIERRLCLKANLKWLMNDRERKLIWPTDS